MYDFALHALLQNMKRRDEWRPRGARKAGVREGLGLQSAALGCGRTAAVYLDSGSGYLALSQEE